MIPGFGRSEVVIIYPDGFQHSMMFQCSNFVLPANRLRRPIDHLSLSINRSIPINHSYPLARRTPLNWNISISRPPPQFFAPLTWLHGPLVVVPFASKQPHLRPFWTVSVVDHAILWLNMTQTCTTRMFQIARNDPSSCSKLLSVAKSCSKLFKLAQNASKCFIFFKMFQNASTLV